MMTIIWHFSSVYLFFCLMIRRPPRSTRTDTLFPYTTALPIFDSSKIGHSGDKCPRCKAETDVCYLSGECHLHQNLPVDLPCGRHDAQRSGKGIVLKRKIGYLCRKQIGRAHVLNSSH